MQVVAPHVPVASCLPRLSPGTGGRPAGDPQAGPLLPSGLVQTPGLSDPVQPEARPSAAGIRVLPSNSASAALQRSFIHPAKEESLPATASR